MLYVLLTHAVSMREFADIAEGGSLNEAQLAQMQVCVCVLKCACLSWFVGLLWWRCVLVLMCMHRRRWRRHSARCSRTASSWRRARLHSACGPVRGCVCVCSVHVCTRLALWRGCALCTCIRELTQEHAQTTPVSSTLRRTRIGWRNGGASATRCALSCGVMSVD
jgi:hypothetical protein